MRKVLCFFLKVLIFTGCSTEREERLLIAAAANVQFAMEELVEVFTEESGISAEVVLGSSGKLTAQISQGAPFDVFVSANIKYPEELYRQGFTTTPPAVYSYGKLVLWTMDEGIEPEIENLNSAAVGYIALANPKNAPYGIAAEEVLHYYGLYEGVKEKLVYGESVAQATQFVLSGTAPMGFTAKSVVLSPELRGKGSWLEVPEESYTPIAQGVVVIRKKEGEPGAAQRGAAQQFYDFLFSEQAQAILRKYGYETPPPNEQL